MTIIKRTANVPYTALQMFALVNAIEEYPHFLPWCHGVEILSQTPDEVRATLHLSRGGIQKSFTTANRLQYGKMVEVTLVDGPFKHLHGFWHFEALEGKGSSITLDLEFEFSNMIIGLAIGPLFQQIASTLVDAFCERAKHLYD